MSARLPASSSHFRDPFPSRARSESSRAEIPCIGVSPGLHVQSSSPMHGCSRGRLCRCPPRFGTPGRIPRTLFSYDFERVPVRTPCRLRTAACTAPSRIQVRTTRCRLLGMTEQLIPRERRIDHGVMIFEERHPPYGRSFRAAQLAPRADVIDLSIPGRRRLEHQSMPSDLAGTVIPSAMRRS